MVGFIQISLKQLILIFIFFVQEFKYGVYSFDQYPPPDSTLSIAGKAADSKVVGDQISNLTSSLNTKFFSSEIPANSTLSQSFDKLRYGHGQCGSVYLSASNGVPASWYWYIYIPHRDGGNASGSDNMDYGILLLFDFWSNAFYIVRYTNGTINVRSI